MTEAELIAWGAGVGHPPISPEFMPEFTTMVCPVTGDELRVAVTKTAKGTEVRAAYLLSMPENRNMGREQQAEKDAALRAEVWFLARNHERVESE